jgi:hypothetical protein
MSARPDQPGKVSWDRSAGTGQDRLVWTGQQACQFSLTGRAGQDIWDNSAGTDQPEQVSLSRSALLVNLDRSSVTVFNILYSNGDSAHE